MRLGIPTIFLSELIEHFNPLRPFPLNILVRRNELLSKCINVYIILVSW
jgi:hypothetical protein